MRVFLLSGFLVSLSLLFAGVVYAQTFTPLDPLTISLSPKYPQPGQEVTATVTSSDINARSATIAWLLNDEVKKQEAGGVSYTFTATEVGSSQTLEVLVRAPDGNISSKKITISPSQVTLLWEADTYTPPFYGGRALYSIGSNIRAEAVPHIARPEGGFYDPSEVTYVWSKNGVVMGSSSGIGAQTLITEGPKFLGNYILTVEVRSPSGTQIAQSSALVETYGAMVKLYERDPLAGVQYQSTITNGYSFNDSPQIELQAIPYFMDARTINGSSLAYTWNINGETATNETGSPSTLNIQLSSVESISTQLGVSISNNSSPLQKTESTLRVNFEGSTKNSLFGL